MYKQDQVSIQTYNGITPQFGGGVFLASGSRVIGDVQIGEDSSLWFNVTVRGDCNLVRIGSRTNIQDNSVVHVTNGTGPTYIGDEVTIGHAAVIHACTIGNRVLIGMGSVILDGVEIGHESVVGAGSVLPPGKKYPSGVLILGSPGKVIRELTEKEIKFLKVSFENYLEYKKGYMPE